MSGGKIYTDKEDACLIRRINKNLGYFGEVQWHKLQPIRNRDKKSMSNRWQVLKSRYIFNGKKWVLKAPNLFDKVTPIADVVNTTTPPQNASKRILKKKVVVKKSFLWGAFKIERYE
tara:strand:- start:936 stop:1286 length:351 start_codon:yes stop_codon:yes gene_type:complete